MSTSKDLYKLGQSLWYDNIERRLLENGVLAEMIERGDVYGVTSNPSIFHNAISKTHDYDAALKPMAWSGWNADQIFWQLAVEDIRAAADLFLPLYEQTKGGDGYVSLEVSPYLAHDTEKTATEAKRLWDWVNRPNLMVKIPATLAGLPAIRKTIAAGINVNVTLIFSVERYAKVMDAFMSGLEDRLAKGQPIDQIASVASFFVSRVDTKVDAILKGMGAKASDLAGKAAIANTRLAYDLFKQTFGAKRWESLKQKGACPQRPLWASTSTKNPAYSDVIYVNELIAPQTVNTVPPVALDAFRHHGKAALTLEGKVKDAQKVIADLGALGISMDKVTQELEDEGVKAFADAFTALLKTIEERASGARAELGTLQKAVPARVVEMEKISAVKRMHERDASLWTQDAAGQAEIRKRLGWLEAPQNAHTLLYDLLNFTAQARQAGLTHVLLLGMGGSSLAPEMFRLIFGIGSAGGMDLKILDATDPAQVRAAARWSPVEKTLYIVSSKSGGTSEVNAFLDYFWVRARRKLGGKACEHFIAITDPGTSLEKLAQERKFCRTFLADPNVGGRYSALIAFGLVPAALIGLDVVQLLGRAQGMAAQCAPGIPAARNPGLVLGVIMGEAALQGHDKLELLLDPEIGAFGSWLEQLIAESSGKLGKGILPVDNRKIIIPSREEKDRLFVYMRHSGKMENTAKRLRRAGQPVLEILVPDLYDLGAEMYRWEVATAIACAITGVNAFDQPDVQDNKVRTMSNIEAYRKENSFNEGNPIWQGDDGRVYGKSFAGLDKAKSLQEVIDLFLKQVLPGDYVAINAYLPRNPQTLAKLEKLRIAVRRKTGRAVTLGFGPRFLHSTGQLHKGGANNGVFLQLTADASADLDIPNQGLTFGTLERAQALGDLEALLARGRRAIRVHLTGGIPEL